MERDYYREVEDILNRLTKILIDTSLSEDEHRLLEILNFAYATENVNILQVVLHMTEILMRHGYTMEQVRDLLDD